MRQLLSIFTLAIFLVMGCGQENKSYEESMAEEHANDEPVSNGAWYEPNEPVNTEDVTYAKVEGNDISGYLATPESATEDTPGIIVIHEWWGLNENVKMMARRLAAEGYTALAVDLYNGKVAETPDSARAYMTKAMGNTEAQVANLKAAHQYLSEQHNAPEVGSIGWCFGGVMSLNTALALPDELDATVIYYGRPVNDMERLEKLQMPILAFFGGDDQSIPRTSVEEFKASLDSLGKDSEIHIYDGAGHAFANPSGNNYEEEAAVDAWEKTVSFLEEHLMN